jgi:hypothetical protein
MMEGYFGAPPKLADPSPFSLVHTNHGFEITAPRSKAATDISFHWEWSPDLTQWSTGVGYIVPVATNDAGAIEWIISRVGPVATTNRTGFIRGVATRL